MNDLVSIIMPSYNTASFILETIQSILNQTYSNWELIIVDDCSTDNTDDIVATFNDPRIHYLKNEKNRGAAISRNYALREAKGKWIAFLDSDDLWTEDKLEKQICFMEENNYLFSYTNYEKIDEKGQSLSILVTGPKVINKHKMYRYCYPGCLTVMFNRLELGELQIEDIKKNNDYAMWLVLCKKAKCYLLDLKLAKYRIRKNSISHDKLSKKLRSHYDLFHKCDHRSRFASLWFACWNIFYGIFKKIKFEKKVN